MLTRSEQLVKDQGVLGQSARAEKSQYFRGWQRFKNYRPGVAALIFLMVLAVIAVAPHFFQPYSDLALDTSRRGESPSWAHPMGLDYVGRDILSRIISGTQIAFIAGVSATLLATSIGVAIGAVAGYFGGWVDGLLSRIVDTLMAFPTLILLITLAAVLGPSLMNTILIVGVTSWTTFARVVRADVMSMREREFVLAAHALGARSWLIIVRHIMPNVLGPVIVLTSLSVGGMILTITALSFLGLGVQPPIPSWGGMLSESRSYITIYPHMALFPGLMIFLTVLAFNLLGDGLRDALDPRERD